MLHEKAYKLFDILQPTSQHRDALPINEGILELAKDLWSTPAPVSETSKHADTRYQVLSKGFAYFYTHPFASSLVITSVNKTKQLGKSTAKEEPKRLDMFGGKKKHQPVCSGSSSYVI